MYNQAFPEGDATQYAKRIFVTFDKDNSGHSLLHRLSLIVLQFSFRYDRFQRVSLGDGFDGEGKSRREAPLCL